MYISFILYIVAQTHKYHTRICTARCILYISYIGKWIIQFSFFDFRVWDFFLSEIFTKFPAHSHRMCFRMRVRMCLCVCIWSTWDVKQVLWWCCIKPPLQYSSLFMALSQSYVRRFKCRFSPAAIRTCDWNTHTNRVYSQHNMPNGWHGSE